MREPIDVSAPNATSTLELAKAVVQEADARKPDPPGTFWMIWNPRGKAPSVMHESEDQADTEAQRLARVSPGDTFVVLKASHAFRLAAPPPPPVERVPLSIAIDDIPF